MDRSQDPVSGIGDGVFFLGYPDGTCYRLPDKVLGLRYQSPPFNSVRFVRLTQGGFFQPCQKHNLKAYIWFDCFYGGNIHETVLKT